MRKILTKSILILLTFSFIIINKVEAQQSVSKTLQEYLKEAPFQMPDIKVPEFKKQTFKITDYGAIGDGHTLNTDAITKTISACATAGGGVVDVPPGLWLTGPLELKSNINLHLEQGAIVLFTPDHTQYPVIRTSEDSHTFFVKSPIYGYKLQNVAITGDGILDGSGDSWREVKKSKTTEKQWKALEHSGGVVNEKGDMWWPSKEAMNGKEYLKNLKKNNNRKELTAEDYLPARDYMRPYMVLLINCTNVLVDGPTVKNTPKFSLYPKYCDNVVIRNVKVSNEWWGQNTDGIDISGGKNIAIYKCTVTTGDDGICMKSSPEHDDGSPHAELQNVVIADCIVYHAHGGFVIGSNTDGGINNIYVTNCNYINTDIGIRVKSRRGSGGLVHNVFINNIYMSDIADEAIFFNTFYEQDKSGAAAQPVTATTPRFEGFHINNVYCDGASAAVSITGLPEMAVKDISLKNINISADKGAILTDAKGIHFDNVKIHPEDGPVFSLHNASDISINDGYQPMKNPVFLQAAGETANVQLSGMEIKDQQKAIQLEDGVSKSAVTINP